MNEEEKSGTVKRKFFPVTEREIAVGMRKKLQGHLCTIPVREAIAKLSDGKKIPILAWGAETAYKIIIANNQFYAVPTYADKQDIELGLPEWIIFSEGNISLKYQWRRELVDEALKDNPNVDSIYDLLTIMLGYYAGSAIAASAYEHNAMRVEDYIAHLNI